MEIDGDGGKVADKYKVTLYQVTTSESRSRSNCPCFFLFIGQYRTTDQSYLK
jgi:hypothetical protein